MGPKIRDILPVPSAETTFPPYTLRGEFIFGDDRIFNGYFSKLIVYTRTEMGWGAGDKGCATVSLKTGCWYIGVYVSR